MMEDCWRRQLRFTNQALVKLIGKDTHTLSEQDRTQLTREYIESLHSELVEVLNNLDWKRHRHIRPGARDNLIEEMIDVQKFLWGMMQINGVTPAEFTSAFNRKSEIVEQRFYQEHVMPAQFLSMASDVVIVDIDGTVADWTIGFEQWAVEKGIAPQEFDKERDPILRERLKDEFYATGGMCRLRPFDGAVDAIMRLKAEGLVVVWLTARPIGRYRRLVGDTVEWLKLWSLPSEYIYWSDLNKHLFVAEKFSSVVALFDDEPEIIKNAMTLGIRAYMINGDLKQRVEDFLASRHG